MKKKQETEHKPIKKKTKTKRTVIEREPGPASPPPTPPPSLLKYRKYSRCDRRHKRREGDPWERYLSGLGSRLGQVMISQGSLAPLSRLWEGDVTGPRSRGTFP